MSQLPSRFQDLGRNVSPRGGPGSIDTLENSYRSSQSTSGPGCALEPVLLLAPIDPPSPAAPVQQLSGGTARPLFCLADCTARKRPPLPAAECVPTDEDVELEG